MANFQTIGVWKTVLLAAALIFQVLLTLPVPAQAQQAQAEELISQYEYESLREIVIRLLRQCPPQNCVYVGLGASPTPLLAIIEGLYGEQATVHLPASRLHGEYNASRFMRTDYGEPRFERVFARHFAHFLPNEKIAGKKILLVDYANSGQSLTLVTKLLRRWLRKTGKKVPVRSVGLIGKEELRMNLKFKGISSIKLNPTMQHHLIQHGYDKFRKYEQWFVTANMKKYQPPKISRVESIDGHYDYKMLAAFMRQKVVADTDLQRLAHKPGLGRWAGCRDLFFQLQSATRYLYK